MGETANTAKMAELLSKELFSEFLWEKAGPFNTDWACVDASHNCKSGTHPSDAVFYYDEPYQNFRTYINCDLKAYGDATISKTRIRGAITSLAQSVACAEQSEEWQTRYNHMAVSAKVSGLLFVYNHDNEYDRSFRDLLAEIRPESLKLPRSAKLVVMGPDDVVWLSNVAYDIVKARGKKELPDRKHCHFFHPDLVRKKVVRSVAGLAATLEMLTSDTISLAYTFTGGKKHGINIYYRGSGAKPEEFLYLIDWLLHYQLMQPNAVVRIKSLRPDKNAPAIFGNAKQSYAELFSGKEDSDLKKRLSKISFSTMTPMVPEYSDIEIGMDDA